MPGEILLYFFGESAQAISPVILAFNLKQIAT